ncbi:gluconokinase [Microbacterium sp. RD1]|uniref:gluconokinase n=1 Tax=Microbacterium sp. RD1 TaxID=3457313 RepID=UPI003FA5DB4D
MPENPPLLVVMGVSAAGKSSVAAALAEQLGVPWVDADALHPAANIAKMASGHPLDDSDRGPWLDEVGRVLAAGVGTGGIVVACSALRRAYRDRIRVAAPEASFVHLTGSAALLAARAAARVGHFMPATLLASQLAILEPLAADERGITLDVAPPAAELAESAARWAREEMP